MSNYMTSSILIIGNTSDVNSINSELSSLIQNKSTFEFDTHFYKVVKPAVVGLVPENCQPSIQGKSYISFTVYGCTGFDCEKFLNSRNIHYDQFCGNYEDESSMGQFMVWANVPKRQIDQMYEENYCEEDGPIGFIRERGASKWRMPSVAETLLLYPMTPLI